MTSTFVLGRRARWATVEVTDLDPQPRTQRRGRDAPRGAASVAAAGRFANPFESESANPVARLGGLVEFAVWLARRRELLADVRRLAGRDLACTCALDDPACHRNVLLDVANPPTSPFAADGRAMALTLRRPWASLLLVPKELEGKTIENRTWATDYRGPILIYGGTRIDTIGIGAAQRAGLDADWHTHQQGWLGAAVLVDVHPARNHCCQPWGQRQVRRDTSVYHWVFAHPHRLAERTWGRGFVGLRPTSWSVLVRRSLLQHHQSRGDLQP
ncbi:DUF4326 domain-containing protein [Mycobacterium riyadhense]|uniref:DUF4326 domain-containing protein n=1 Tax=Mycobacterium riyadhense TaxID=486698 RepID=UPI00195D063A|nr:DUF4326 domain-containing protein [Mycobacterium riyadhense]